MKENIDAKRLLDSQEHNLCLRNERTWERMICKHKDENQDDFDKANTKFGVFNNYKLVKIRHNLVMNHQS